jgi:hypothetical protein
MASDIKFKLSRLREIGWEHWDPIGLKDDEGWPEDEYDRYLMHAAGMLWNGESDENTASYLVTTETEYIGLTAAMGVRERALATVSALREYVEELRG